MKNNIIIKTLLAIIFLAISSSYLTGNPTSLLNATLYLLAPLLFMSAGFYVTRLYGHGSDNGNALFFISLGASCWMLAEIIWYVFKFFMDTAPFPSIADGFFLLAYPLFFVAIYKGLTGIKTEWTKINRATLILNLLIAIILTAVVSYWGIYKAYDQEVGNLENIFAISYGIGDLFLVMGVLWATSLSGIYREGKLGIFWKKMTLGFFLYLIADILFAMYQTEYSDGIKPYVYIDIIWISSYFVLAYGLMENAFFMKAIKDKIGDDLRSV